MKPPSTVSINETSNSTSWFDDGIMYVVTKRNPYEATEERKKQTTEFIKKLNGKKICAIIDVTNSSTFSRESREYNAIILPQMFCAIAFIARNPLGRMLVNLYLGMKPLAFPHKIFSNEEDAKEWILQHQAEMENK
jgi:hypothetical protein